ncbi:MAG: response regulator, partial [Roseiarcus sp.]
MFVTRNGMEALSSVARDDLKTNLPNIVVVDLNMPVLSGEVFLRLLRTELQLPSLPAVVLTTSNEKPVHDAAMAAGADQVFVKPGSLRELELIAREILEIGVRRAPEISRRPV